MDLGSGPDSGGERKVSRQSGAAVKHNVPGTFAVRATNPIAGLVAVKALS